MSRRLEVNVRAVVEAMTTFRDDPCTYFVDIHDGTIREVVPSELEDDVADPYAEIEPDRHLEIPRIDAREDHETMTRFVGTIDDRDVVDLLEVALAGRGAFGRFREVVSRDAALQRQWFAFKHDADHRRALEWLKRHDLDVVDTSPPPPAPIPAPAPRPPAVTLVDVLLLGAPDGKTGLVRGQVHRVVPARKPDEARRLFREIARDICAVCGHPWRRSLVDGKATLDLDRFHLRIVDRGVELAIDVSPELWRRFSER